MRRERQILATTHVDLHGDRMTLAALESLVGLIKTSLIPVGVEHDPRIAPVGRVVDACIREVEDGEYGVEAEVEMFEEGDVYSAKREERAVPIHEYPYEELRITCDRGFRSSRDKRIIGEIAALFGTEAKEELKKAVDPVAVVMIGGAFVLAGVATGFLKRLGEDAYDKLKRKLGELFDGRRRAEEVLLRVNLIVGVKGEEIEVDLLATSPDRVTVEALMGSGIRAVSREIAPLVAGTEGLKRLVFEYERGSVRLRFGVRRDGVPVFWPERDGGNGGGQSVP